MTIGNQPDDRSPICQRNMRGKSQEERTKKRVTPKAQESRNEKGAIEMTRLIPEAFQPSNAEESSLREKQHQIGSRHSPWYLEMLGDASPGKKNGRGGKREDSTRQSQGDEPKEHGRD